MFERQQFRAVELNRKHSTLELRYMTKPSLLRHRLLSGDILKTGKSLLTSVCLQRFYVLLYR